MNHLIRLTPTEIKSVCINLINDNNTKYNLNHKDKTANISIFATKPFQHTLLHNLLTYIENTTVEYDHGHVNTSNNEYFYGLKECESKLDKYYLNLVKPIGLLYRFLITSEKNFITLSEKNLHTFHNKWKVYYSDINYNITNVDNDLLTIEFYQNIKDELLTTLDFYMVCQDDESFNFKEEIREYIINKLTNFL